MHAFFSAVLSILVSCLFCGFIAIGVAANHNYNTKTASIVGVVIGFVLGICMVAMGITQH
jgi:hypothetical protein